MKILLSYLKKYKWTVLLALLMTALNQGFSLIDPLITGKIVDNYIIKRDHFARYDYLIGIVNLLLLGFGAALSFARS